ncbi:MAG TPA: transcriptional regulator [Saprospiraceae bacterium]|nr:transcriptional regulator [Saprospiraceae bacterium]HND89191.1 transcriptional regulator [Saprospiraceae bacterium]
MKDILTQLNPVFDHRNRLGIMSVLVVNDWVEYGRLKDLLNLTDGNLASHMKPLEAAGYVEYRKQFVGRRPQTTYAATSAGKADFKAHLAALEALLKMSEG